MSTPENKIKKKLPAKKKRIPIVDDVNDYIDSKAAATQEYYTKKKNRSFDTSDGRPSAIDTLTHVTNHAAGFLSDVINPIRGRRIVGRDETDNETLGNSKTGGTRAPYYGTKKKQ